MPWNLVNRHINFAPLNQDTVALQMKTFSPIATYALSVHKLRFITIFLFDL